MELNQTSDKGSKIMGRLTAMKNSSLFEGLSDAEIDSIEPLLEEKRIEEGKTVFVENMVGESLYLIEQGTIKISKMLAEGDEKILVILGPDDFFGEMAILEGTPRSATARVAEDACLLSLQRKDFEAFCDNNPKLGLKLMRNIVRTFTRRVRENSEEYREMLIWSLGQKG
jgi:CRP-like cAMP-binding protein